MFAPSQRFQLKQSYVTRVWYDVPDRSLYWAVFPWVHRVWVEAFSLHPLRHLFRGRSHHHRRNRLWLLLHRTCSDDGRDRQSILLRKATVDLHPTHPIQQVYSVCAPVALPAFLVNISSSSIRIWPHTHMTGMIVLIPCYRQMESKIVPQKYWTRTMSSSCTSCLPDGNAAVPDACGCSMMIWLLLHQRQTIFCGIDCLVLTLCVDDIENDCTEMYASCTKMT